MRYVALLRGITPTNPKMSNARLRRACEALGLGRVETLLSSGNLLFEAGSVTRSQLETRLESAWGDLGFASTTIVRSRTDLQRLFDRRPFGDRTHSPRSYLLVTFSQRPLTLDFALPYRPPERDYRIVAGSRGELCSVTDTTTTATPDVMTWMEQRFGKQITSRTWLTVTRILERLSA